MRRAGVALALAGLYAALAAQTWRRWSDPVIDFGAELYLAWRLVEGDRLYADLAYRNGPLSPHLNALWFALFGTSVETLALCNLALLALLCALVYRLLAPAGGLARGLACAALLVGFGFAQFTPTANYNWALPYQHSQTHGVLLGVAMIAALGAALRTGAPVTFAAAGACLGLAFLTKSELFVPALAAAATGAGLACADPARPRPGRGVALLAAAALAPPVAALALLAARMPIAAALDGVLGNWRYLGAELLDDPFYAQGTGVDDPAQGALEAARAAAALAAALAAAVAADRLLGGARRPRARAAALALALFAALVALGPRVGWLELARGLPAVAAVAAAALAHAWRRAAGDRARRARAGALLLFSVYALGLLGKMLLHARFGHYGFALALPATLLLVAGAVEAPARLARRAGGSGVVARALGAACVAAALLAFWSHGAAYYARKTFELGPGDDAIRVEEARGRVLAATLRSLRELAAPGSTLLVLPEGASLNYWLRLPSPSRYWLFLPTEFTAVGGDGVMAADVRARPPELVALVDRSHAAWGVGPFGEDARNGRELLALVRAEYELVRVHGAEPFRGRGFGVSLWRRRGAAQRPPPAHTSP